MEREIYQEICKIRHEIQLIHQELGRYKAFVSGIMWCCGAAASALGFLVGVVTS